MDVCGIARYSSLWITKELTHATGNRIFYLVMDMMLHMVVNQYPRISPRLYTQYCHIANFKVDLKRVYVKVMKDPSRTWNPFPYLVIDDDLLTIL